MGQKKTWALHHVPYSMLWDNMSLDYRHQWLPVLQGPLSSSYSTAIVDYQFKQSIFSFVWKSPFMTKGLTTRQFCTRGRFLQVGALLQNPAPVFEWTTNSNRGTNETMIAKSYLIKMQNTTTLLNLFFRADFFEQKQGKAMQLRLVPATRAALSEPVRQEMHKRVRQLWPSVRLSSRRSARVLRKSVLGSSLDFSFGHKSSPFRNLQYSKQLNTQYYFKLTRRKAVSSLKKFQICRSPAFTGALRAHKYKRYIRYNANVQKRVRRHPTRAPLQSV